MSAPQLANWHNAGGNGLAYRPPPSVDEALPYSPFTSIVPFSPEIIPFPLAEPPTPPSTLTTEQQTSAQSAVAILNNEIKGQSTAEHLSNTLRQLRQLLQPNELPEYIFKPVPQSATLPPDNAAEERNGSNPSHASPLSPFASLLLKNTAICFTAPGTQANEPPRKPTAMQHTVPKSEIRAAPQPQSADLDSTATPQNANRAHQSSVHSQTPRSTPVQPGPAVLIQPKVVRKDEYQLFDNIVITEPSSQKKESRKADSDAAFLRPHEREIADRKIEELQSFVSRLSEDKEDLDPSGSFSKVSTDDGELTVLQSRFMDLLSDKMSNVINLGRFAVLPVDLVMKIQSLLEPSITCTGHSALSLQDEDWSDSLDKAKSALTASKLVLSSMIEGSDDYRIRREDIIGVIIDLIKAIKNDCIVPIIQSRRSDSSDGVHEAAMAHRKGLMVVLRQCGIVLSRFATLIGKVNLPDRALNVMEDLTLGLLVEQNSDSEKDSVFGIQKFEQFRQKAMDVLAQIFARHAEQRTSILNGILSNLEKLPDKKASARQFKSAREAPIMSISALFMRFVQVAATNRENPTKGVSADTNEQAHTEEGIDYEPGTSLHGEVKRAKNKNSPSRMAQDLTRNANHIAGIITSSLVDRASNVSKTGDKPFRNLLDLFIEDFCNVLGSPEWPAAAMLLSALLIRMATMVQGENSAKQSVVDKDMALSTMAKMGCGVIDFKHRLKLLKRTLDISQSNLSAKLDRLMDDVLTDHAKESIHSVDLYAFDGPYRIVIESLRDYLDMQHGQEDPHLQSVTGCHVTLWLDAVIRTFPIDDADIPQPEAVKAVQSHLESMFADSKWLSRKYKFQDVSESQSKLAAGIVTLQTLVCKELPRIVHIMLHYTRDKASSKLRSRGMTGLEQLIEQDPRVIDENTVKSLVGSLSDNSPMVREHTLSLVSKCLEHEPSLERHFLPSILRLTTDTSNGPKKKAIKLLKDVYVGPTSRENKLQIAAWLLLPSQDDEKAIAELSRNVLEEIWLMPTPHSQRNNENQIKLDRNQRASFMADIVQLIHGQTVRLEAFEKFFTHALSPEAKNPATNLQICQELVADMVDEVISPETTPGAKSQAHVMHAVSTFAKVRSTLFTMDQVQLLKLYIKELVKVEELSLVQPTVTIFRHVFPTLPSLQRSFAEEVRANLMGIVAKLSSWAGQGHIPSRDTLIDVAHCLWIVSPMVDGGIDKLFVLVSNILCQLRPMTTYTKEQATTKRNNIASFLILIGTFGKVCAFDQYNDKFREKVSSYARNVINRKGATEQQLKPLLSGTTSASLLLLETVRPFTMQTWEMSIREHALRSLGGICQQSPELFMRAEIEKLVKLVFINQDNDQLKLVALTMFNDYFTYAERRSETGAEIAVGRGAVDGSARLETSFVANENDSATLHLAQKFLSNFVDVALKNNNDLAFFATNIIASISRQGLVHPKECGAALVALGTSSNVRIAQTAGIEHKRIHEKQESYLEKEYMQAVRMAFDYQRDVFSDSHGMLESSYAPKLAQLFDALKTGKKVTFKKFVQNLCKQIDFDLPKLTVNDSIPDHVLFARFCLENISLLDFPHLESVAIFIDAVEAIVLKTTGPLVALAIETEMPKQIVTRELPPTHEQILQQQQYQMTSGDPGLFQQPPELGPAVSELAQPTIDNDRLRRIAAACMVLQMVWETRTFVRRCYNLHKFAGRIPQKEYAKPAQRNNFVSGKELLEHFAPIMTALDSRETMVKQCYDFADLLEVDRETQVDDEDDTLAAGYETPTESNRNTKETSVPTSGRGRKRKSNATLTNTPKKPRGRPTGGKNKKRGSKTPDGDDDSD